MSTHRTRRVTHGLALIVGACAATAGSVAVAVAVLPVPNPAPPPAHAVDAAAPMPVGLVITDPAHPSASAELSCPAATVARVGLAEPRVPGATISAHSDPSNPAHTVVNAHATAGSFPTAPDGPGVATASVTVTVTLTCIPSITARPRPTTT